ncbi:MAG: alpha/beta fold hydrolase [Cytophagales bacterium]|nr:alpha/beta fold hydrolase [Cytophagales bacterium]
MKKILMALVALIAIYFVGPQPNAPVLNASPTWTQIPDSMTQISEFIQQKELGNKELKPGNEAKIIWADSLHPQKTKYAFLYVHGFSASQMEGDPVHRQVAAAFNGNLVLARVAGHGEKTSDRTLGNVTADDYYASVENYLAIAKKLGQEVIVMGTSFGGAMTIYLASKHPEIKAIILYGPCIEVADPSAALLDNPWGLQLARIIKGGEYNEIPSNNKAHDAYWNLHYRFEAVVEMQNFLTHTMNKDVFSQVKIPVLLTYYYKDEGHQDQVVSVKAMQKMFPELGTDSSLKREIAFPESGNHVITSPILGNKTELPMQASVKFLNEVVQLKK